MQEYDEMRSISQEERCGPVQYVVECFYRERTEQKLGKQVLATIMCRQWVLLQHGVIAYNKTCSGLLSAFVAVNT